MKQSSKDATNQWIKQSNSQLCSCAVRSIFRCAALHQLPVVLQSPFFLPKKRCFRGPCSFFGHFWHPIQFHTFRSCHLPCHQIKGFVASHSLNKNLYFLEAGTDQRESVSKSPWGLYCGRRFKVVAVEVSGRCIVKRVTRQG